MFLIVIIHHFSGFLTIFKDFYLYTFLDKIVYNL